MKKIILTVAALAAFGVSNAQEIKFGAKAGINLANISDKYDGPSELDINDSDNAMKVGAQIGGFVEFKFSEKFALQPEVLFSMQGATLEQSYDDGEFYNSYEERKINLTYINIPVMVKFYPIPKLFVEAGPQVGFLVSAKDKYKSIVTFDGDVETESKTIKNEGFKSIDFGMNIGAGYEITEMIFVNLRYNIGLTDISENSPEEDELELGDLFNTKNSVLSASIGFKF